MRKVHERLPEAKKAYLEQRGHAEIARLQRLIQTAVDSRLDEMHIIILKKKLAKKLVKNAADVRPNTLSNDEFLQQLTKNSSKQISSPRDTP